uniref:Chloride channel CLIC-like protein 1 n=1 Tax=Anopheles coluzzii TaxID=1518534 RepID=A0A8W7PM48_ANOCL
MLPLTIRSVSFVCILLVVCLRIVDCRHDPKWIKTGALDRWGQQQQQKERSRENHPNDASCEAEPTVCDCLPVVESASSIPCSPDISEDQRMALVYYRKLVQTLFARNTPEPPTKNVHTIDLSLRISTREQAKLLDESTSARELNWIVSAVLQQSDKARQLSLIREQQCERLYDFLMQLFESKIVDGLLLPAFLLIAGCYAIRVIARITRLKHFPVFLLLILSITVCKKWKECNENLARQSLEGMETTPPSRWTSIFGMFRSRKDGAGPLPICDPLQVLVESTVWIQAVYFKSLIREYINTYTEITNDVTTTVERALRYVDGIGAAAELLQRLRNAKLRFVGRSMLELSLKYGNDSSFSTSGSGMMGRCLTAARFFPFSPAPPAVTLASGGTGGCSFLRTPRSTGSFFFVINFGTLSSFSPVR